MKRLIIADLKSNNNYGICTGHYYAVAANYQAVFRDEYDVKIASGPIYLNRFRPEEMIMLPCDYIVGDSKLKNTWRMLRNGSALRKQTTAKDVIIIQQSQPAMILFTLLLTFILRPKSVFLIQYTSEPMHRIYYRVLARLCRHIIKAVLCSSDEIGRDYGVPFFTISDYIYVPPSTEKKNVAYNEKQYDCCMIGRISEEKGVREAVGALAGKQVTLLVAGVLQFESDENALKKAASENCNINLSLKYLSEIEYFQYIQSSRYAILNYTGAYAERSSGVVLDTLFNGLPIIGRRCKALQFIENNHLGVLYNKIEEVDFSKLLDEDTYNSFQNSIKLYISKLLKKADRFKQFIKQY